MSNATWCEDVKPGDILIPIKEGIEIQRIITPAVVDTIRKTWSKDVLIYSFSVKCHRKSTPFLRDLGAAWFEGIATGMSDDDASARNEENYLKTC